MIIKKYLPFLIFTILFLFVTFIFFGLKDSTTADDIKVESSERAKLEKIYKELKLETVDGNSLTGMNIDSNLVLINFWASWCIPCMRELPGLNRLSSSYSKKDLSIIAINSDVEEQKKLIEKTIRDFNLKLFVVPDKKNTLVNTFGVTGIPTTFFFKRGKLVDIKYEEINFDSVKFRKKIKFYLEAK